MIGECFIDALGAAKSVIAQNSIIEILLEEGFEISKSFGEGWEKKDYNRWKKKEKYIITGITRHYCFLVKIPEIILFFFCFINL